MHLVRHFVTAAILWTAVMAAGNKLPRCDMCECTVSDTVLKLNCSDSKPHAGDPLGPIRLPYPESYNIHSYGTVEAEFERNKITMLVRINIHDLTKLSLAENNITKIEPGIFMRLKYLRSLSLKSNGLKTLQGKSFQGLIKLQSLDLSRNALIGFGKETFTELKSLKSISLAYNKLNNISGSIFPNSLQTLDLSFNLITKFDPSAFASTSNLTVLNLSNNKITSVDNFMFISLTSLIDLDLSQNDIVKLDSSAFVSLKSLRKLSLSNNQMKELPTHMELPPSLTVLDLGKNKISDISAQIVNLKNLQELHLQQNSLTSIRISTTTELKVLNVSGNQISSFSVPSCRMLEVLDLSSNQLTSVPQEVHGIAMPALRWLSLDSNLMHQVQFPSLEDNDQVSACLLNLTWVSISHLSELVELNARAFSGLSAGCGCSTSNLMEESAGELEALTQECKRKMSIRVSHNPRLVRIHPEAFKDVAISKLYLDHNSLSSLDEGLMEWEALESVDLQGNPWLCTCALQWVLNRIMPYLYDNHPELLYELRCDGPAPLRNKRLVHFYKWEEPALCSKMELLRMEPTTASYETEITMGFSGPMLVVVLVVGAVGVFLVIAAVVMQRRYNHRFRIRNRRL